MARIGASLLLVLACTVATEARAQESHGVFVEPRIQAARMLDRTATLVGGRAGYAFRWGLVIDGEVEVLTDPVYRDAEPYFGARISRLARFQFGIRYQDVVSGRIRYDIGVASALGPARFEMCGGPDACAILNGYAGLAGEIGLRFVVLNGVSIRADAGYDASLLGWEGGVVFGTGVRVSPMVWGR